MRKLTNELTDTVRVHRVNMTPVLERIACQFDACDPFIVLDQPTPADITEYLRHSDAQFAFDAATAQRHRAERETR
jgi:hypothetical protein